MLLKTEISISVPFNPKREKSMSSKGIFVGLFLLKGYLKREKKYTQKYINFSDQHNDTVYSRR